MPQYLDQLSQFSSVLPLSSDWRESLDDLVELSFSENLFSLSVGALGRVPLPQQFCLTLQSHQLTKCVWKWWCKQCWQEHHRQHEPLKNDLSKSKAYLKKVHCAELSADRAWLLLKVVMMTTLLTRTSPCIQKWMRRISPQSKQTPPPQQSQSVQIYQLTKGVCSFKFKWQ